MYQILRTEPTTSRCKHDSLGFQPQTFTYNRYDPSEDRSSSLLSQAEKMLGQMNSNAFVQLSEKGAKAKHYGVSMLHQLHSIKSRR